MNITLRPWFRWVVHRFLLAAALYSIAYTGRNALLTQRVEADLTRLRARGEPVDIEDLASPPLDPAQDAGPFFRAACELWEGVHERNQDQDPEEIPWEQVPPWDKFWLVEDELEGLEAVFKRIDALGEEMEQC